MYVHHWHIYYKMQILQFSYYLPKKLTKLSKIETIYKSGVFFKHCILETWKWVTPN